MSIFNFLKRKNNLKSEVTELPHNVMVAKAGQVTMAHIDKIAKDQEKTAKIEFKKGYDLIKKYPRSVSIMGSARFKEDNNYYQKARHLTSRIAKELGYAIVTGGGPGIMEAASRGAYEVGGVAIGFNIRLPHEQSENPYLTEFVDFEYFFSRKTLLFFAAETYIYFPGGFGTMDEFFELITLIQTGKISAAPVILVGREFWQPIVNLAREEFLKKYDTVAEKDLGLYKIVDDEEEILKIIKNAPYRTE
jgi:uncharacterized protein (TIGR00730 family)